MNNGITVLGRQVKPLILRKIAIWFGVVSVLLCSIVGSGILSLQEGTRPPATTQQVAVNPTQTPTVGDTATPTATFAATWTPSPTATPAPTLTTTTEPDSTAAPTPSAAATYTATPTLAATATPTPGCHTPAGWTRHTVQAGDTLTGLAWRYDTTSLIRPAGR